jgi:hypothetical protein
MSSPRLSAGGIRFLDHRVPAEELGLPSEDRQAYWPEGQTSSGLPRSASVRYNRGGCRLYCVARRCPYPRPSEMTWLQTTAYSRGPWAGYCRISHQFRQSFITSRSLINGSLAFTRPVFP